MSIEGEDYSPSFTSVCCGFRNFTNMSKEGLGIGGNSWPNNAQDDGKGTKNKAALPHD